MNYPNQFNNQFVETVPLPSPCKMCQSVTGTIGTSTGANKPENAGKQYYTCINKCKGSWIGWVTNGGSSAPASVPVQRQQFNPNFTNPRNQSYSPIPNDNDVMLKLTQLETKIENMFTVILQKIDAGGNVDLSGSIEHIQENTMQRIENNADQMI